MKKNLEYKQSVLKESDRVIAVSSYVKNKLEAIVDKDKIAVIPNIMNINYVKKAVSKRYMLFIGNLTEEKGILFLLEALKEADTDIPTIVIGDGNLRKTAERTVKEDNLNVSFLGRLGHNEAMEYLSGCGILLFPSLWPEPLSRVLIEASMIGVPIIATNTGGTPDIIEDGKNGILSSANSDDFAKKLVKLIRNNKMRNRIRNNAKRMAELRFGEKAVMKKIENIYNDAIIK
jgi:glycosyltransferase involved in cell wall biosynthesis